MQVCGVKDPDYSWNITTEHANKVDKAWGEIRRILNKCKTHTDGEKPSRPGGSVYPRHYQIRQETYITKARQSGQYNRHRLAEEGKQKQCAGQPRK